MFRHFLLWNRLIVNPTFLACWALSIRRSIFPIPLWKTTWTTILRYLRKYSNSDSHGHGKVLTFHCGFTMLVEALTNRYEVISKILEFDENWFVDFIELFYNVSIIKRDSTDFLCDLHVNVYYYSRFLFVKHHYNVIPHEITSQIKKNIYFLSRKQYILPYLKNQKLNKNFYYFMYRQVYCLLLELNAPLLASLMTNFPQNLSFNVPFSK